jgi:cation/acetate symporter
VSDIQIWTLVFVGITFSLYIYIAFRSRVKETKGFYVAGGGVPAVANGAAIGADWMSAASFISMAGIIAFTSNGYSGGAYLMGWTGGYVLLALLIAPYLRKFGKYTVPDFVGDRYNETARLIAVVATIIMSLTYVAGQMRGVGVVFTRFLEVNTNLGVVIGMVIVFFYAVLGGMKGITWTQVAQYSVLIVAYMIPAFAISSQLTNSVVPHIGFGEIVGQLNGLQTDLGFPEYSASLSGDGLRNMFLLTLALMCGTAGLPHILVRFYTAKDVRAARYSALWALFFIALLYTTAPTIGAFSKFNVIEQLDGTPVADTPSWFNNWAEAGLISVTDANEDGIIQLAAEAAPAPDPLPVPGQFGELVIDNDIVVLATPEIAGLPAPIVGLVAAGGLAAALSTASGLLLAISSAVANDVYYKRINPQASEARQVMAGRIAIAGAIVLAGYFGVNPPAFVAQVVAIAFGLACSALFPIIVLGIFWKRANAIGAASGLLVGFGFTLTYVVTTVKLFGDAPLTDPWFLGIPATAIGAVGMVFNFIVTIVVSLLTKPPPALMQELVEEIRYPGKTALVAAHIAGQIDEATLHGEGEEETKQ